MAEITVKADPVAWRNNRTTAEEFCKVAFGSLGVDPEPYIKIVTELLDHAAPNRCDAQSAKVLDLLQISTCFRGDVCALLPCACAETLAAAIEQSVRAATIEECAKVCDLHAEWASYHHRENEAPESGHNQLFATIGNTADACAELIRDLSETKPARCDAQSDQIIKAAKALLAEVERTTDKHDWLAPIADLKLVVALSETKPAQGDAQREEALAIVKILANTHPDDWLSKPEIHVNLARFRVGTKPA